MKKSNSEQQRIFLRKYYSNLLSYYKFKEDEKLLNIIVPADTYQTFNYYDEFKKLYQTNSNENKKNTKI